MKTKFAITLIVAALLSLAGTVEARDSWRGHKGGHDRDHVTMQHRNKHYRSHGKRHHYRSNHYYQSRYAHHRHKHHHSSFRDGLRFAAGALILGSVVHSINNYGSRQVVYQASPAGPDRWYRVDQDGQCVEVRRDQYGEEVWTYTESYRCY